MLYFKQLPHGMKAVAKFHKGITLIFCNVDCRAFRRHIHISCKMCIKDFLIRTCFWSTQDIWALGVIHVVKVLGCQRI